jgi:hypothetical protein
MTTTQSESPKAQIPRRNRRRANRKSQFSSLALPILYAAVGTSLGTLTGIAIAFVSQPAGGQVAYIDSSSVGSTLTARENSPFTSVVAAEKTQPAAVTETADNSSEPAADTEHSAVIHPASGTASANAPLQIKQMPASQADPGETPAVKRNSEPRTTPREHRSIVHPFARFGRPEMAGTPAVAPEQLNAPSLDGEAVPSTFYTEGDVTVADYNATSGTFESSDGRTFFIGTTVSESDAASWNDYRSDVHYRCSANGSCTLQRPGVVATDARLVQES